MFAFKILLITITVVLSFLRLTVTEEVADQCKSFLEDKQTLKDQAKLRQEINLCIWKVINDKWVSGSSNDVKSYGEIFKVPLRAVAPSSKNGIGLQNLTFNYLYMGDNMAHIGVKLIYKWLDGRISNNLKTYSNLLVDTKEGTKKLTGTCEEVWCANLEVDAEKQQITTVNKLYIKPKDYTHIEIEVEADLSVSANCDWTYKNYPFDIASCCFALKPTASDYFRHSQFNLRDGKSTYSFWDVVVYNLRTVETDDSRYVSCFDIKRSAPLVNIAILLPTLTGFVLGVVSPMVGDMKKQFEFKLISITVQFVAIIVFMQVGAGWDIVGMGSTGQLPNIVRLFESGLVITLFGCLLNFTLIAVLRNTPVMVLSERSKGITQIVLKYINFVEGPGHKAKAKVEETESDGKSDDDIKLSNERSDYYSFLKMINTMFAIITASLYFIIFALLCPKSI